MARNSSTNEALNLHSNLLHIGLQHELVHYPSPRQSALLQHSIKAAADPLVALDNNAARIIKIYTLTITLCVKSSHMTLLSHYCPGKAFNHRARKVAFEPSHVIKWHLSLGRQKTQKASQPRMQWWRPLFRVRSRERSSIAIEPHSRSLSEAACIIISRQ